MAEVCGQQNICFLKDFATFALQVIFPHSKLGKSFLLVAGFVHIWIVMLNQERDKLLTQSWKQTVVLNSNVSCSIEISLYWN